MLKLESPLEELFFDNILVNFEILSIIKSVRSKVILENKRYDFALEVDDHSVLLIEVDSKQFHSTLKQRTNDSYKDYLAENYDIKLLRFGSAEIFGDPEKVANKIEETIELLKG